MGVIGLSNYDCVALDTSIFIYFFEDHEEFGAQAEEMLSTIIERKTPVIVSELLFTELLVLPLREGQNEIVQIYRNLGSVIPSLQSVAVDHAIAIQAAQLRATYNIRTPDAIHLATAMSQSAELFICNDKELQRVKEIEVLCL